MLRNLSELYRYRSLLWALVVRQLASRYRGSALGFLWSFLNPLLLMLVYTLVFRFYVRFESVPNYTVFVFTGLLPWLWSVSSLSEGTSAISSSGHLITKSMFPAHLLPTVSVLAAGINYILSLPILFIFMFAFGIPYTSALLCLPLIIVIQFLFLWGITIALSAINVHFRDVQHIVANLLTFLFFLCPILYPAQNVPPQFSFTINYNPIAVLTGAYHHVFLDGQLPGLREMGFLLASAVFSLALGNFIFNRYRETFAEML